MVSLELKYVIQYIGTCTLKVNMLDGPKDLQTQMRPHQRPCIYNSLAALQMQALLRTRVTQSPKPQHQNTDLRTHDGSPEAL